MRNNASARIKQACENKGSVKSNMAKRWAALCKAKHVTQATARARPEMARWAGAFNDTFARLKGDVKKEIATWTLSCAPACFSRVTSLVVELAILAQA